MITRRLRDVRTGAEESGAGLVEAAFVFPIFFLLVFGMLDYGVWAFQVNQATVAARDGARVGILQYEDADDASPPSADYTAIADAVRERLAGQTVESITVECIGPDDSITSDDPASCSDAERGVDRIKVQVRWQRRFFSFVGDIVGGGSKTVTGISRMVIVGLPIDAPVIPTTTTTAPPPTCVLGTPALNRSSTRVYTSGAQAGKLRDDVTVTVTTNGSPACGVPTIRLVGSTGNPPGNFQFPQAMVPTALPNNFQYTYYGHPDDPPAEVAASPWAQQTYTVHVETPTASNSTQAFSVTS